MKRRFNTKGFTLVEILITCAISVIVAGGIYATVQAATVVSAKALAGSSSSTANRLAMDRIGQMLQLSYDMPVLINHNGADVTSGTASAQGIRFQRYMGAPYVVTIPSGGLQSTAESMTVTVANNAQIPLPPPEPNDILVINTTAMAAGIDTQVAAYINGPVGKSVAGNRTTYTLTLSRQLGTTVTADTGATVTAILVRPTAFVLKPTNSGRELRMIESYPKSTTIDTNKNYVVVTPQVVTSGTISGPADPMTDDAAKPFSLVNSNGRFFAKVALGIRAIHYDNYLKDRHGKKSSPETYVKTGTVIALKCNPNQ